MVALMALEITGFEPQVGLTAGGTLVVITGLDFAPLLPTTAPPNEPLPAPAPSVRVRFGTLVADKILAQSETRLIVISPPVDVDTMLGVGDLDPDTKTPTAALDVLITVENLDELGDVTETAESVEPFLYRLQQTSDATTLVLLTERVINSLRAWLHPRVYHKPHPDYAFAEFSSGEAEVFVFNRADAPAYALLGPTIVEDRFAQQQVLNSCPGLGDAVRSREPYYDTITYQLLGFAETSTELLAMYDHVLAVFRRWKFIPHPSGEGNIDVDLTAHPRPNDAPNNSGLQSFTVEFRLGRVPVGLAGPRFPNDLLVEWSTQINEPEISYAQAGTPQLSTPSPGSPLEAVAVPGDAVPALRYPKFGKPPTILLEKKP